MAHCNLLSNLVRNIQFAPGPVGGECYIAFILLIHGTEEHYSKSKFLKLMPMGGVRCHWQEKHKTQTDCFEDLFKIGFHDYSSWRGINCLISICFQFAPNRRQ